VGLSGTVTTTLIARTVRPAWPVPSEQLGSPPPLSQNCSLRITKPIPGSSSTVFGGGATLTGTPSTDTPAKVVPASFEDAAIASAALFDCERTTVALTMQL